MLTWRRPQPLMGRSRQMRAKRSNARVIERLEERALLAAVTMASVTETDARTLSLTYQVSASPPSTLEVDFFRQPSSTFNQAQAVKIGSTTLSGAQLTPGNHNAVAISLPNNANGPDPLSPDPLNKFVFAVAQNTDGPASSKSFEKLVFAAVTHGYEFFSSSTPPDWVAQIAKVMNTEGYLNPVIPFNWSSTSGLDKANQGIEAGDKLAGEIVTEMKALVQSGTIPANAVVDIQLICHSRGSVVMTRVMQDLAAELDQIPNAKAGYWRLTLLDPHPSHFDNVVPLVAASGFFSQELLKHARKLQTDMKDPFPLQIPAQVADVQDYFETHLTSDAPPHSDGTYINPWGTSKGQGGITLLDPSKTEYHEFKLTAPGITHSEVHDWYQVNVVPKLGTATTIFTSPNDALLRAEANDVTGKVNQATSYDYVATFTDDDPTATDASDYKVKIDWGDGTSEDGMATANEVESGFTVYATHKYQTPGKFTFIVTITDLMGTQDNGGSVAVVKGTATIKLFSVAAVGAPAGTAPLVALTDASTGQVLSQFPAFPASFHSGVSAALGDVNDDGSPDIVAAAPLGGRSLVRVFDGVDHHLVTQFFVAGSPRGLSVTTADLNHDGRAEVIVGTGSQVRVFDGDTGAPLLSIPLRRVGRVRGAVPLTAIDVNHDRFVDIVAGSGASGQTQVIDGQALAARLFQIQLARQTQAQILLALQGLHSGRRFH